MAKLDRRIFQYNDIFNLKLDVYTRAIMDEILKYVNVKGFAFPSQERIAEALGISRETVSRKLSDLERISLRHRLPFLIKSQRRAPGGKFKHNVYYFPWVAYMEVYLREQNVETINTLIEEYYQIWCEEVENSHDRVIETDNNKNRLRSSLSSVADTIRKLSEFLQLKASEVMKILSYIGYELSENKLNIHHMDKYLQKAFLSHRKAYNAEETIKGIYSILFGENRAAVFYTDWDGYADLLLNA